jgi:hypothetical protein
VALIGQVSGVGLAELLQVAALAGGQSVLEVRSSDATAWFGFEAGAIVRFARSDLDLSTPGKGEDEKEADGDDLALEHAENALLEVFRWSEGEFVLHCGDRALTWPGPDGIQFRVAVRPESVALGAARRMDEERRGAAPQASGAEPAAVAAPATPQAVVVVDPELRLLQKLKEGLKGPGRRIHIFTRSEEAWFRIQQYLLRGEIPSLVLGEGVKDPVEPGCRPGWRRFTARLQGIAPSAKVVLMSSDPSAGSASLEGVAPRPADLSAEPEGMGDLVESLGRLLARGA